MPDHETNTSNLFIGIGICLIGSTISNLGLNIQKYSFIMQAHLPDHERKPYNTQWRWWLGFFGVGVGSIADFAALTFAAQSIIMPVGAFTLVCNIVFAHFWLKEKLTRNDLWGTVWIVVGAVMVTIFGSHENTNYTLHELLRLYYRWDMLIYLVFIIGVLFFLYSMLMNAERILKKKGALSTEYKSVLKTHPLAYAGLAGVFGAQSVMFAKSTGELIKQSASGDNQFNKGLTYVILVGLVLTISMQTHLLSLGLKYFDALYIVPVFQCFFITFSVLGGAIYFQEFKDYTVTQYICFPLGVFITIYGVWVLSSREMQHDAGAPPVPPAPPSSADSICHAELQPNMPGSNMVRRNSSSFRVVMEPEFCPVSNPAQLLERSSSIGGSFYATQSVLMSGRSNTDFQAVSDEALDREMVTMQTRPLSESAAASTVHHA
ncbi:hypothetical protein SDRG_02027 [Saprolegnia diclina VS20]|uniref:Uncharacterized protein n=1 Tax=Saprolegnia diclina (strain VS20) TaxID=1156394 RepID=T0QS77_SAPDV|nr:hypothetical protein SDRG_02027 [Saprolegnia diclina VS20]EQC40964.1 hypothetical protein SDRG_02027 [Saprolegnia diclina VS20]|eukprot:XP_008605808.1 hypothetical protein SDRG_02027 [Saprolegnia diclina VS20]